MSASAVAAGLRLWAERTPGRVAIRDRATELTFEELDGLAGTLARGLIERLGADRASAPPIPILVGVNCESVVAIHAAARAGVPHAMVDPGLPPAAIADLFARLGDPPFAVVARADTAGSVPAGVDVVLVPDRVDDPIASQPVRSDDVATVIFTSGSTGRPKGVVYEWANLDERMRDLARQHPRGDEEHFAVTAPLHWLAGWGRMVVVGHGTSVAVAPAAAMDPLDLLEWFDREQATVIPIVPSLAAQMVSRWPASRRLESVRTLRMIGEALMWEQVPALRQLVHREALIQAGYGSSESCCPVFRFTIESEDDLGTGAVPLGEPLVKGRARFEPVDAADEGGPAELVVCGSVARGYWGDPELTAARFGVDPDGTRWWRSGDLGRLDEQGRFRLSGRADDLVKIRGKLVEPAEPELVLHGLSGVRQAVVLPHHGQRGTRLVAHLVLEDDATLTAADVRTRLAERLAPHLVPSPLVLHPALPVTPNNKIDRVRLRSEPLQPWRSAAPREPRDELEASVGIVCAEVLEFDAVGPDDDLWELGLDSLAAVELVEGCSALGWGSLEPTAPLARPTPALLADLLRSQGLAGDPRRESTVSVMNPEGSAHPIVALPGAGGTALAFYWLARALGGDQPLAVVEAHGLHTLGDPDRTIEEAVARTASTVGSIVPDGPITLVGHSAGGVLAYATAQRLHDAGRSARVVLLDSGLGATGPGSTAPGSTAPAGGPRRSPLSWRERLTSRTFAQVLDRAVEKAWIRYYVWRPGSPKAKPARFRAFTEIGARAVRGYRPPPARFSVLILCAGSPRIVDSWKPFVPDLRAEVVPGGHNTLLRPPHVAEVAQCIARFHADAVLTGHAAAPPTGTVRLEENPSR